MWIAVTNRFRQFHKNLLLTEDQIRDGTTKNQNVRKCLNQHYYGSDSGTENSFLVGSWAKLTRVRPPRDVDVYFELPVSVYHRLEQTAGNKQSAILQEVKRVLQGTYPVTDMRGDGQVVIVRFNTMNVEVAPVFLLDNGRYYFCNTHNGGSYDVADPVAETNHIASVDRTNNNNLRPLIRMMKTWQSHCSVPIKSFQLELVMADFLQQSPWRENSLFYYDWFVRDFFAYLHSKANGYVFAPGTMKAIALGDDWLSRCETAYHRAFRACEHERDDHVDLAGEEWQKIFGTMIPKNP